MRPHPITAVDLVVRDLDRSLAFYTEHLGLPPATVSDGTVSDGTASETDSRTAVLDAGPAVLRLREDRDAADSGWVPDDLQKGFRHIGFTVSDIDARAARLHEHGVQFRLEPKDAYGGVRIAFFFDPDGVLLEFVQGHLTHDRVQDQGLVDASRAAPPPVTPTFDHVAMTVSDLDTTVRNYADSLGFGAAGQLIRDDDPRGFVITYLHAGRTVLEVFTYTEPKLDSPWRAEPPTVGFRDVSFTTTSEGSLVLDPDGFPLRVEAAR